MNPPLAYSVERTLAHDLATVWEAWTDAARLERWYHPTDLANVPGLTESEARVGGRWAVAVNVPQNGFVAYFHGVYSEVEPHRRLRHTLCYTTVLDEFTARDPDAPAHDVVIDFDGHEGGTRVKFSQYGVLPEGHAEKARAGMESYLDSLERFLGSDH
jgi:uncharacterized protein YndB with AHSA1/START domain